MTLNPVKRRRERCRASREAMSEYIDDGLGAEREDFERHLSRCPNCRRMLQNLTRTVTALRAVGEHPGSQPE